MESDPVLQWWERATCIEWPILVFEVYLFIRKCWVSHFYVNATFTCVKNHAEITFLALF